MTPKSFSISPDPDTKVNFRAATAHVRDAEIYNHDKPIYLSSRHRGIRVKLDIGYILIERKWFSTKKK